MRSGLLEVLGERSDSLRSCEFLGRGGIVVWKGMGNVVSNNLRMGLLQLMPGV